MRWRWLAAAAAWGTACAGQTAALEGPVSGVLFDEPSRAIRVVNGIPGAAYLGAAVASGLDAAWLAPDGGSAVVEREGARFLVTGLRSGEPRWRELSELAGRPEAVAWSAEGRAAAAAGRSLIVLEAEGAARVRELPGPAVSLAVSGETVWAAVAGEGVYRSGADGRWEAALALQGAARLSAGKGGRVFALEEGSGDVFELKEEGAEVVAAGTRATAVQAAADGKTLLLAAGGDEPSVRALDLATRQERWRVALDGPAQGLEALPGSAYVLVSQRKKSGDVITILAGQATEPGVFFIPAGE